MGAVIESGLDPHLQLTSEFSNLSAWQRHISESTAFRQLREIASNSVSLEQLSSSLDATDCIERCANESCATALRTAASGHNFCPLSGSYSDYGSSIFSTTEIFRTDDFSFILMAVDSIRLRAGRSKFDANVELNGSQASYKIIGSGKLKLTLIQTSGFDDDTDFSEEIPILSTSSVELDGNSPWFSIDGKKQGFRIEEVTGNVTIAIVGLHQENCGFRVILNSKSSRVVSVKPFYQTDSKILSILSTFASLRPEYFLEVYKNFLDYRMFFIRSHAIRLLCEVAPDIAKLEIERRLGIEKNPMVARNLLRLAEWLN